VTVAGVTLLRQRNLPAPGGRVLAACAGAVVVSVGIAVAATSWPLLLPLGILVAAVMVVSVLRLDLAVLLLAAAIPLEYSVSLAGVPQLTVVKLAGGLCFAAFIVQVASRRIRLRLDVTHVMLLAILGCILVAAVAARSLDSALLVSVRYVSYVGIYFVVTAFAGDSRTLERIVWVLSIACAVAGVLAIHNLLTGFATRATPTYGDANDLAYILSTTLPLTLWLLRRRGPRRLAVLGLIAVIGLADALTFSRGAAVGLGCALTWVLVTNRHQFRAALVPLTLVAIAVGVVGLTQQARLSTAFTVKSAAAAGNVTHRFDAWRSAVELIVAHPLIGVGPGNFQYFTAAVDDRPPTNADPTVVHNTYLDVGAEIGLPALALLLAYVVTTFKRLRVAMRRRLGPPSLAIAVTAAMIAAVAAALTLSEQYYAPLWMLGALATCLWQGRRARSAEAAR
jgi:putative inorganic carbon (HCO3(-)) transporter